MEEAEVELAGTPTSIAAARRFVDDAVQAMGAADLAWSATQIVSELATNAVVHTGTSFVVRVVRNGDVVRLSVTDRRPLARVIMRRYSQDNTTGRGMRLVEDLGEGWGIDQSDDEKTVWAELRVRDSSLDAGDQPPQVPRLQTAAGSARRGRTSRPGEPSDRSGGLRGHVADLSRVGAA